jgi:hypothetical protein
MLQRFARSTNPSKRLAHQVTARFFTQGASPTDRPLVQTEVDGKIATLTLSRPAVNSLSLEM